MNGIFILRFQSNISINTIPFLLIGGTLDDRVNSQIKAFNHFGFSAMHIDYKTLYNKIFEGDFYLEPDTVIKLDSPSRNLEILHFILTLGIQTHKNTEYNKDKLNLINKGLLLDYQYWFTGFKKILIQIHKAFEEKHPYYINNIRDILLFSDKKECHKHLLESGINVPKTLNPITSFEELTGKMKEEKMSRVFVKTIYGSSASGVLAFQMSKGKYLLKAMIKIVKINSEPYLFNTRQIQHYKDKHSIKFIIDTLAESGIHVEQWIPKAMVNGYTCDLRIVIINGEPKHIILRQSKNPITNLHLLNHRGDASELRKKTTQENWDSILNTCKNIAGLFPEAKVIGADIAVSIDFKNHYVLELNAFGDYIHHCYYQNLDPFEYQAKEFYSNLTTMRKN